MKYKQYIILFMAVGLSVILSGCGLSVGNNTGSDKIPITNSKNEVSFEELANINNTNTLDNPSADNPDNNENLTETDIQINNSLSAELEESSQTSDTTTENYANPDNVLSSTDAPRNPLVLQSEDWGLNFGEEGSQPKGNANAADLAAYNAYFVGNDSNKVIYLTFDCGYENGNTDPILDALKKHNITATFFVVGHFLETAPELVKRMVEDGHTVGNHTYHHPDMSAISTIEDFQKEVDAVANLFHEITGSNLSMYYRAPQGKCNVSNLEMAQQLGYSTIFWSLAYVDWDTEHQPSRSDALDKLTKRIHPGAVVLLHNTSQTNGQILDELLTKWEEMGYSFAPLADLCGA